MAGTSGNGLGGGRAPQLSIQLSQSDEDEFALAAMGISDGYRPTDATNHNEAYLSPRSPLLPNMVSSQQEVTPPPRPSSISKPPQPSFSLQHDGQMGHVSGSSSTAAGSSSDHSSSSDRRLSTISVLSSVPGRSEEPYSGPTGPSFAYSAYNQQAGNVRASLATTVVRSERSYQGPMAPVHPYGMYPQNTAPESESVQDRIAIGFPGRNNDYLRRTGPEGEEVGDMIGPDGHTEALPPYSQYPDEAFARKARLAELRTNVDGAGGIGMATRNPEFESQTNLSRSSTHRTTASIASTPEQPVSPTAVPVAELSEKKPLKKWQERAKKKVCGVVPLWALVLAITVLISFVLILATTLYALRPRGGPPVFPPAASVTGSYATQTYDAEPIFTAPPGLLELPTGTFALPIAVPSAVQNSCLKDSKESKAWSCMMPQSPLQIQVLQLPGDKNFPLANKQIILDYGNASMTNFPYGTQPPVLREAQIMNLVTDTQDPGRGPAWFFQTTYNKVVVVPGDLLSSPYEQKRDLVERDLNERDGHKHHVDEIPINFKAIAQPGEAPWFCYWNGTMLEAFLYVNQSSSEEAHGSGHVSKDATVTATSTSMSATKTSSSLVTGTASPNGTFASQQDDEGPWGAAHEALSGFPKVIKIQERRTLQPQTIFPYCVKKFIAEDGSAQDMRNSTGQVITIYLDEVVPPSEFDPMVKRALWNSDEASTSTTKVVSRQTSGDQVVDNDKERNCGCVWLAT